MDDKSKVISSRASKKRHAELNELAQEFGFPNWTNSSTFLKRSRRTNPITIIIGTGREKKVLTSKGSSGAVAG